MLNIQVGDLDMRHSRKIERKTEKQKRQNGHVNGMEDLLELKRKDWILKKENSLNVDNRPLNFIISYTKQFIFICLKQNKIPNYVYLLHQMFVTVGRFLLFIIVLQYYTEVE